MLAASPDAFPAQALCRTNRAQRSALSSLEKKKSNNLPKYLFAAAVKGVYFPNAGFPNVFCWELIGPCSFARRQNNLEGALQVLETLIYSLIYIIVTYILYFSCIYHPVQIPAQTAAVSEGW